MVIIDVNNSFLPEEAETLDPHDHDSPSIETPPPVWIQKSSKLKLFRYTILPLWSIGQSMVASWESTKILSRGPENVRIQKIRPYYETVQTWPVRLQERVLHSRSLKIIALMVYWISYLSIFAAILYRHDSPRLTKHHVKPVKLSCEDSFWKVDNDCGLNGDACRPFQNATFPFRCPASCIDTLVQQPYLIGDREVLYTPLVIGGAVNGSSQPIYRADSLICQSAIHAGIISNSYGGCGIASFIGAHSGFPAVDSNGIQSYASDPIFPKSFTFLENSTTGCKGVIDARWHILALTILYTMVLSLSVASTACFFWSTFSLLFICTALASDPPDASDFANVFALFISRVVPAFFIGFVYYRFTIFRTLNGFNGHIEKTILWLGAAWAGALNNYTFKDIPIQRLTPHDLNQAGAIPALVLIASIIFAIAVGQAYCLWLEHRFRSYLALYSGFIAFILIGVCIPSLHVRLHHYLLAMLLLPGTSMQTRPSLLYQGLLIGLFINGVSRWGFAPILETPEMLYHGRPEAVPLPLVTSFLTPDLLRLDLFWSWPPAGYNGVSIIINDIERHRWFLDNGNVSFSWYSNETRSQKEYIRLAYMHESLSYEYTQAGVWDTDHSWSGIGSHAGSLNQDPPI